MIYLSAFIGSLLFVFIRLKIEKQKQDETGKKINWKKYFKNEWDDFAFSVIAGQILTFFQESIFHGVVKWMEWNLDQSFYNESKEAIAGGMGLFGSLLILLLFMYIVKKASKLSDD